MRSPTPPSAPPRPAPRSCTCTPAIPKDGRPSQDPEHFAPILDKLKRNTDAVINITTGGSPHMTVEERMRPAALFKPELASLNMGSMNFGLYPMLDRFTEFGHEWEREGLEKSRDLVFKNTFQDIETILGIGNQNGTRFEFECYDISHLNNLAHFHARGLAKGPLFVQSVFGLLGGIGAHPEDLMHMRRTADRLLGEDYEWSILGAGKNQMPLATIGAAMGSHVRVGLEDSLWIGPGTARRRPTPSRSPGSGPSSRPSTSRSPPPTRPGRCCSSRAVTTSVSERQHYFRSRESVP